MDEYRLSLSRLPVYSVNSWELYMADHCWRQLTGVFRLPGGPPRATFGALSTPVHLLPVVPRVDDIVREGDYDSWFRDISIGRFTTTVSVHGGMSVGAEQARFYEMFLGDPDAVRDVMAEMDRRRRAGEGSSRDVP